MDLFILLTLLTLNENFVVKFGVLFFLNGDDGFFFGVYMRVKILRNLLWLLYC